MRNNNRINFILSCLVFVLIDIFLIFGFIGDILILTGSIESYIMDQYGLYAIVGSLIFEITFFISSIILLILSFRKYKYAKK